MELGGVIVVVLYVFGALLAAQFVAPWLARSQLLSRVWTYLGDSLAYAMKGVAATAVLVVIAMPVYLLATADGGTRGVALQLLAAAAGGYLAMVVVGWLADHAVAAFLKAHPEYEEWDDLFGTPDDQPAEVATDGGDAG